MNAKSLIWIGVFVGTTIGGFLPTLWGADFLSISSIVWSTVGGIAGIYLGFKLSHGF